MNPLFNQLYKPMSGIQNMINAIKAAKNPQAMIQNMAANNPQVQQLLQQSGGDPKAAFYNLARQKGVNPDDVLKMLR